MASALSENPASVIHSLNLAHNTLDNQGSGLDSFSSLFLLQPSPSEKTPPIVLLLLPHCCFCLLSESSESIFVLTEPLFSVSPRIYFLSYLSFVLYVYECSFSLLFFFCLTTQTLSNLLGVVRFCTHACITH